MAAMAPEKSRNLHNFSLPPRLNWGTQKLLRCATFTAAGKRLPRKQTQTKPSNAAFRSSTSRRLISGDDQIEAIREKLMLDLRSEVDKMRAAFLGNPHLAACKDTSSPATENKGPMKPSPAVAGDCERRAKFSVSLSRLDIEDDYAKMVGKRPPRKPKKRPRHVQRQLDDVFPGLWLSEITADMYKVDENPEGGK